MGVLVAAPDTVVLLGCRDLVRGEVAVHQLETELGCQDRLLALQLDVTSQESVAAAADWTRKRFTSLAGLVNNAGATYLESARAVMEVNYFGAARVCEAFIPLLEDAGRIVNISSFGAQVSIVHLLSSFIFYTYLLSFIFWSTGFFSSSVI